MYKMKKSLFLVVLTVFLVTALLQGCSKQGNESATTPIKDQTESSQASTSEDKNTELPPVELIYNTIWAGATTDLPEVNEELNKMLKEKINATIKINAIPIGDFEQKMNVITATGEYYDLAFTAYWCNNYYKNVANESLMELDELLPKYAPNLWKTVPKTFWDSTRVNGKIYGVENYQIGVETYGFNCDMDFLDTIKEKTGYATDINSLKKIEDLEPLLEAIKKADMPDATGFYVGPNFFSGRPVYFGYDVIGDPKSVGWVKLSDDSMNVVNQYETQEYKDFCKLTRKWYLNGYIRRDAAIVGAVNDDKFEYIAPPLVFVKPGQGEALTIGTERPFKVTYVTDSVVTTQRASATMIGISSKSKNPDRALMYLDLMGSDENFYNLLVHGIQGKHYNKTGEKTIEIIEGSTYEPYHVAWALGNQFLEWLVPGMPENVWEETKKLNETAKASPILGFSFDPTPVKTELASCQTVLDEFIGTLDTGSVDPEEYLPKMLNELKVAGSEKIVAEKQRQINEWRKANNK